MEKGHTYIKMVINTREHGFKILRFDLLEFFKIYLINKKKVKNIK